MSESIHVLVVRAGGLSWALPMGSVEQTFAFGEDRVHDVAGVVLSTDGEVVPVLEPGVIAGAWSPAGPGSFGFSDLQRSALLEIANIGSGNAATALSQLLGKPVEIGYAEALLATLAEAADKVGAAAAPSAVVDTPVADDGGKVLLLFPDGAAEQLCELFGTRLDDEMGRSALREVGNILASSYLNAVVEMTGLELDPEPPTIEVDLLGSLVSRSLEASRAGDPTVLMRSVMTVESSDASFAFLFVPQFGAVEALLERLGVGGTQAHPGVAAGFE
jgi:chemotaxis protein CheC